MSAQFGITIVKKMAYRGDPNEEWSNTYWFTGTPPGTQAEADSAAQALATEELPLYLATCEAVRAYIYNDNAPHTPAAFVSDLTSGPGAPYLGTMLTGTGTYPAGDQAAWIRWATARRTSKGRLIYLRKYYHGVPTEEESPTTADQVVGSWLTPSLTFSAHLAGGTFWGFGQLTGKGHVDTLGEARSSHFITTRTLERRGKRP